MTPPAAPTDPAQRDTGPTGAHAPTSAGKKRRHRTSGGGRFAGAALVVTGGASGIGAATCRLLAAEGARVGVLDRNASGAESLSEEIGGMALVADVTEAAAVERAVMRADAEMGGLSGLVNNAGIGNLKPLEAYTEAEVDLIWRVNVAGTYNCLRAAAPILRRRASGAAVVNVASVSGIRPTRGEAPYSAAKAAVIALTRSAALEWAPEVRVNCLSPGFVATPLNEVLLDDPDMRAGLEQRTPLGRVGTAEEAAEAIAFLLSDAAGYLTGHNLVLDGGSMLPSEQMDPVLGPLLDLF